MLYNKIRLRFCMVNSNNMHFRQKNLKHNTNWAQGHLARKSFVRNFFKLDLWVSFLLEPLTNKV